MGVVLVAEDVDLRVRESRSFEASSANSEDPVEMEEHMSKTACMYVLAVGSWCGVATVVTGTSAQELHYISDDIRFVVIKIDFAGDGLLQCVSKKRRRRRILRVTRP